MDNNQKNNNDKNKIYTKLSTIGIKPAASKIHEYGRVIALIIIIFTIIWVMYLEHLEDENDELIYKDIECYIKKDSIMYNSIMELDVENRKKYIRFLKKTFESNKETLFNKYYRNISIALIAGICSEYIISGNLYKPLGVIGKTTIYTALNNILTL